METGKIKPAKSGKMKPALTVRKYRYHVLTMRKAPPPKMSPTP